MSVQAAANGSNFTIVNLGKFSELSKYSLKLPQGTLEGKVFVGQPAKLTGCEMSFAVLKPGVGLPFFHVHHQHEEVYCILSGNGEYQVDDQVYPIEEGSVIRVGTGANRNIKNTGTVPMVYQCIQTMENSYKANIPNESEMAQVEPKFSK